MRVYILLLCSIISGSLEANAQNGNFSRITVRDSIWLNGKWIKAVSDNAAFTNPAANVIPSQLAIQEHNNTHSAFVTDSILALQKGTSSGVVPLDHTNKVPNGMLPQELDGVFSTSASAGISAANIAYWNTPPVEQISMELLLGTSLVRHANTNTTILKSWGLVHIFDVGNIQANLPDPVTCKGRVFIFKNMSAGDPVTFNYPIKSYPGVTTKSLSGGSRLWIISDGADWQVIL